MVLPYAGEVSDDYNRASELKAFDDSKAGVKGLVDSGVSTVPGNAQFNFPVIDLHGVDSDPFRRRGY